MRMDGDDLPIGRVLSRRDALGVLGAVSASGMFALTGRGASADARTLPPACVVRPEETEGPYFVDDTLHRSDIRSDPSDGSVAAGAPLALAFEVSRIDGRSCVPLAGAVVDVWHCDALGVYSDVRDAGFDTVGKKFLRGYQTTDARGVARFATIYPGWYRGRTVHIHFKIRFKIRSAPSAKPRFEFTSQLYFDDALTDRVHAQPPYAAKGRRTMRNEDDRIYADNGSQLVLSVTRRGDGYSGTFPIALTVA